MAHQPRANLTSLPSHDAAAITPSNTTDLSAPIRAFYVGVAGDVKIKTLSGNDVTFVAVPAGSLIPVGAERVYALGTSATSIVGIY